MTLTWPTYIHKLKMRTFPTYDVKQLFSAARFKVLWYNCGSIQGQGEFFTLKAWTFLLPSFTENFQIELLGKRKKWIERSIGCIMYHIIQGPSVYIYIKVYQDTFCILHQILISSSCSTQWKQNIPNIEFKPRIVV